MENRNHQNSNFNKLKSVNGYEIIFSDQQRRDFSKFGQLLQKDKTWILHHSNGDYDFTNPKTGLKRGNPRNSTDFLSSENLILKFHGTYPLHPAFYNCDTPFICNDNYFRNKEIFDYYLRKNENKNLKSVTAYRKFCWDNKECDEAKIDVAKFPDDQNDSSPIIDIKYNVKSVSETSPLFKSEYRYSNDSHTIVNRKNNVLQVFCANGFNDKEFAIPVLTKSCISETYLSTTEPTVSSSFECITTCFRSQINKTSKKNSLPPMKNAVKTTRNELQNNRLLLNNTKKVNAKKTKCELQNPPSEKQNLNQMNPTTFCGQHLTSPNKTTSKCHKLKERSCHENGSTCLSALSLFLIIKDMNTENYNYCHQTESYDLLSTALICLRMNSHSERKNRLSNIERTKHEQLRSCYEILRVDNDDSKTITCSKVPENPKTQFCPYSSNRNISNKFRNHTVSNTDEYSRYEESGIETQVQNEKRYPKELNLLLSFKTDKKTPCHAMDCPYEGSRAIQCQSGVKLKGAKTDKTAQASVSNKSACIQLSLHDPTLMRQQCNQICPSNKSACVQPSSTIVLRKSEPTTFCHEANDTKYIVCGAKDPVDILRSPPPCPLFVPIFEEKSTEKFLSTPQKHVMCSMATKLNEEKFNNSLECTEVNKGFRTLLTNKKPCTLRSKPSTWLSCDKNIPRSCSEFQTSNSSNCMGKSSTKGIHSVQMDISSYTCKDLPKLLACNGHRNNEEELDILKLKETLPCSKMKKKGELFSTFDFRSANDFVVSENKIEDLMLITEDFKNLEQAIERFLTMDITDTTWK